MLKDYVSGWDARIAAWIEKAGKDDLDAPELIAAYHDGDPTRALQRRALPEPYVGNPLADALDAVVVNLNPGSDLVDQRLPAGEHAMNVAKNGYHAVYSQWCVPEKTSNWWARRRDWVHRILPDSQRRADIFGIDLFPWHSAGWGGIAWTQPVVQWMESNVIDVVRSLAPLTRLGKLTREHGHPAAALAVGASVRELLKRAGYTVEPLLRVAGWPDAATGEPSARRFYRCTAKDGGLQVLVTTAPRSNTAPSALFDGVVRHYLGIEVRK